MSWFIGVPIALEPGGPELPPATPDLVVLAPGDRHVTFAFLGRAPDDDVAAVWSTLPSLPLPAVVSALRWERFGRSALALVVADAEGHLEAAAEACHRAADGRIELQPPSPFRPHVTMARVPRRRRPPSSTVLRAWPLPQEPLGVGPLTLFRSRHDAGAGRYEVVEQRAPSG